MRSFWRDHQAEVSAGCVDGVSRTWQYGLNYYAGHEIPECAGAGSGAPACNDARPATRDGRYQCTKSCTLRYAIHFSQEAREAFHGALAAAMAEARKQLPKLADALEKHPEIGAVKITRRGKPVLAVLSWDLV